MFFNELRTSICTRGFKSRPRNHSFSINIDPNTPAPRARVYFGSLRFACDAERGECTPAFSAALVRRFPGVEARQSVGPAEHVARAVVSELNVPS